jgi:hypothetical protein
MQILRKKMEAIIVRAQFIFDIWNENNGMGIKEWGEME